MQVRKKRLMIAPLTAVFFVGMLFCDRTGIFISSLLAAGLHECGHLLAARQMQIPLSCLRLDLFGARIDVGDRLLSYGEEWLLAAAGPLFSLVGAVMATPFWTVSRFFVSFSVSSFLLGLLNLLPVKTFDGGRMAEALLCCFIGARCAFSVMRTVTLCFLFLLWSLSVYLLIRAGGGLSLFCFSVNLLSRFLESGEIS